MRDSILELIAAAKDARQRLTEANLPDRNLVRRLNRAILTLQSELHSIPAGETWILAKDENGID